MSYSRKRHNARRRCPGHDYRSKCIYHIVLNKTPGVPDFSEVRGIVGSRQWPPTPHRSFIGDVIGESISSLKAEYPFTQILRRCIMPDHVHFVLNVTEATEIHLGILIKHIKNVCFDRLVAAGYSRETKIFEDNYHDTFLSGGGQLQRMLDYVSDNPRRHLVRKASPSWFQRFMITDGARSFEAYGNWDLLVEPQIVAVRAGREYRAHKAEFRKLWSQTVWNDGILVSPFINDTEKAVRDWAMENGGALIYVTPDELPPRYKPEGDLFDLCGEGRLMIVSVPGLPEYRGLPENIAFRKHCLRMNEVSAAIAAGKFR